MTNTPAQSKVLIFGWASMLVGLLMPTVAAVAAMQFFRNLPCTEGVRWAAAPLVFGCEPLTQTRLALGWIATICCLGAFVAAGVVAVYASAIFIRAHNKREAVSFLLLPAATVAIATTIALVLLSDPDARSNAQGSWIAHTSFAGLATYGAAGVTSLTVRFVVRRGGQQ